MARHGENIRKRKDGRWEGRYLAYSEEKGRKLYRSVYGRTYWEAKEKLILQKSRISDVSGKDAAELIDLKAAGNKNQGINTGMEFKQAVHECVGIESKTMIHERMGADSKKAADGNMEIKFMEASDAHGEGKNNGAELLRFSAVAMEWLTVVKTAKKPSTYVKYTMVYRKHLEPLFRNEKLSVVITPYVREKISDSLSESMRKSVCCVLNQVLKFACEKYAAIMPPVKLPVSSCPKKPVESLSRKEQSGLLAALYRNTDRFKSAVLLCLHTGLRLGELCALKWEDIDRENQFISVKRTVQRLYAGNDEDDYGKGSQGHQVKTVLLETAPKSLHSKREIPLPPKAFKLLAGENNKENEYVFGGSKPVEPRTMQNRFKKILKEAGLENKKFHVLRHTFSTNCIESGADAKSLSEILGHSDVQITLNRYVHPSMEAKRRHLDMLSSFYSRIYGEDGGKICGQNLG